MTLTLISQGDTSLCFKHALAAVLRIHPDELPAYNPDDPDWPIAFRNQLRQKFGVELEVRRPDRCPMRGYWIGVFDLLDPDSDDRHAMVCRDEWIILDPSGRFATPRAVAAHRVTAGVRVR